jgi:hypothetical protein
LQPRRPVLLRQRRWLQAARRRQGRWLKLALLLRLLVVVVPRPVVQQPVAAVVAQRWQVRVVRRVLQELRALTPRLVRLRLPLQRLRVARKLRIP